MSLPNLEFAAAPAGIAHKRAGIGQIGAGIVRVPLGCFTQALEALAGEFPPADSGVRG